MEVLCAGRALIFQESPHLKPHLWFIVTDPVGDPSVVVAVMVRTATRFTDTTLILKPGDHPFVRHESSVHYSTATQFKVSRLEKGFALGTCKLREDMGPALLARVRQGLLDSPYTVQVIREYSRELF